MKRTIEEIESQLEQQHWPLQGLIPPSWRVRVSLQDKKHRKKRKNASAENWSAESGGEIVLRFEKVAEPSLPPGAPAASSGEPHAPGPRAPSELRIIPQRLADLVRALDHAESRPGFSFVALKWFRDVALPAEGFPWAGSETSRGNVLREAIEQRRLVLISRVPNPKSPQFRVTAIRLNRSLPEVRAILGIPETPGADFQPVEIRGEHLSATVLRERR